MAGLATSDHEETVGSRGEVAKTGGAHHLVAEALGRSLSRYPEGIEQQEDRRWLARCR